MSVKANVCECLVSANQLGHASNGDDACDEGQVVSPFSYTDFYTGWYVECLDLPGDCPPYFKLDGDGDCVPFAQCEAEWVYSAWQGQCMPIHDNHSCPSGYVILGEDCWPDGVCPAPYHDDGAGVCITNGDCAWHYYFDGDNACRKRWRL